MTNTGSVDADDVVLGFLTPPDAGKGGVPLKSLFGFERVHVEAGHSVVVDLYPALTDFVRVDLEGRMHAHPGQYTVSFGVEEASGALGQGFAQHVLTAR